jgi:hypothetical protein
MSSNLFRAILALDAHNRGYLPRINKLGGIDTYLGNAKLILQSDVSEGSPGYEAPFYAIACQIGEGASAERIISYRGTDNLNVLNNWNSGDTILNSIH